MLSMARRAWDRVSTRRKKWAVHYQETLCVSPQNLYYKVAEKEGLRHEKETAFGRYLCKLMPATEVWFIDRVWHGLAREVDWKFQGLF